MTALMNLLTEDVTFWADGGGKVKGVATRQLSGRSTVIRFMLDNSPIFRNTLPADSRAELAEINGQLALITRSGDRAFAVLTIDVEAEHIRAIRFVANPDKLAHIQCRICAGKEIAMTSTHDFPTSGVELRYLLVASDYARSLAFYCDLLGAKMVRQISDVLCLLSFGGSEFLLTVGGDPTRDKPTVTFAPPTDPNMVNSELNIRVPDCFAAYEVLCSRGAEFLTPPVDWGYEVRAFLRDPDGHLIELTQSGHQ